MADLVNRIQQAILGSTDDHEHLRGLLRELQIPTNAPQQPDALERVRKCILYSGASESELRDAFAGLDLTGGGSGDKRLALQDIRAAILRNLASGGSA